MQRLRLRSSCMRRTDRERTEGGILMKIGFIGLGNMAQAMIGGILKNVLAAPEEIYCKDGRN